MKDVELICELLTSINAGGPIHKKQAIDNAIGNGSVSARVLTKTKQQFRATMKAMRAVFPELKSTRFRNTAEFYSLFLVMWNLHLEGKVLNNRTRNAAAMALLRKFSDGVDLVREQQRSAQGARADQRLYTNYLMNVQQSTDALPQRRARAEIIGGLLHGLFETKDSNRGFSPEQRRLLWNSETEKECTMCGVALDWTNFHIDHKKAHSRGGKTSLRNAALSCVSCNTSKGARSRKR